MYGEAEQTLMTRKIQSHKNEDDSDAIGENAATKAPKKPI